MYNAHDFCKFFIGFFVCCLPTIKSWPLHLRSLLQSTETLNSPLPSSTFIFQSSLSAATDAHCILQETSIRSCLMRKRQLRTRLRFLLSIAQRRPRTDPRRWLNDAPRPPPIAASERISDASSTNYTDLTLEDCKLSDATRLSEVSRDRTCLICLEDVPRGTRSTRLPCEHAAWHSQCVATWLRAAPRCPLCNSQVSSKRRCYRERFYSPELAWTLYDRRVPEQPQSQYQRPSLLSEDFSFARVSLSSHDLPWSLDDRRLSLVSAPQRQNEPSSMRRFGRSLTLTPRNPH